MHIITVVYFVPYLTLAITMCFARPILFRLVLLLVGPPLPLVDDIHFLRVPVCTSRSCWHHVDVVTLSVFAHALPA